ncbi:acyl-CoA dehydrogenase family protein, partial [Streptomyces fulvoviolaceus]|uniref:acyl-CoA dehydrogenase family protein n=1 Tax=Streptomyces fulvoviolaceus TaxID=285535 RepID=UPI0004C4B33D
ENITALREAGLLSLLRPKRFGGLQTDIRTSLEIQAELARGCGSTSWVAGLGNVTAFFVAMFSDQTQHDVWGDNPDSWICAVYAGKDTHVETLDNGWR